MITNKSLYWGSIAFLTPCRDMNLPEIDKDKMDVFYMLVVNVVLINFGFQSVKDFVKSNNVGYLIRA